MSNGETVGESQWEHIFPEVVGREFTNPTTISSVIGYCCVQFISLLKAGWLKLLNSLSKSCVVYRLLSGMPEMLTSTFFIIILLTTEYLQCRDQKAVPLKRYW